MRLKVLTLNAWGGRLLDNIIEFIHKENPDICLFQEVHNGLGTDLEPHLRMMNIFKEKLGLPYSAYSATHREKNIERGNAIFSKYPLTVVDTIFFDVPYSENYEDIPANFEYCPRNMQWVEIDVNSKKLNIFNVHGIWGTDGNDNDRRLFMSQTIVNKIKDKENVILGGDFNVNPDTKTMSNIEPYLKNVFKGELTTTFNMKYKTHPGFATAVVDMMYTSPSLTVVEHSCPEADVSDHCPLVTVLEV